MNRVPFQIMALARQWLPDIGPRATQETREAGSLPVELQATVQLVRRTEDDRAYVSVTGEILFGSTRRWMIPLGEDDLDPREGSRDGRCVAGRTRERLVARCSTEQPFGPLDPFLWIQILDDRGAALTQDVYLGHGMDVIFRIHTRTSLGVFQETICTSYPARFQGRSPRTPDKILHGVSARLLLRTFGGPDGARFQTESVHLPLLPNGWRLRAGRVPSSRRPGFPPRCGLVPFHAH